ncbi:2-amino-4-hydroxy-6-hydroxymethyldihydropteridine diphosphokinase [Paenibacillus sp. YN15]|uniref:2-amino-4-hydroxy-6- hydroxymethyldihydropteridine diphosphokinase n=1 Tax=Paenibacillus sp. YN15 TaxID=1742774 RepID=UPI000DCE24E1|nr:2-amino-4-hydroxy-6-hydroxymethyldihydropteridine diphosphokinase [Paenibacillus sp. YN15]RAU95932.1 2-amino-4-hydroxy-6-hydroxymethyldihydropteridine diphosphokinase [Paenibacillus sp. YN15]
MNQAQQEWTTAYIGLGSNLGDREAWLAGAVRLLDGHPGVRLAASSAIYETEPVGYVDQPVFLNMALRVETRLPPEQLLAFMMDVERQLERKREVRWGPRTIDLDMLLYGDCRMDSPALTLPHPRMLERAFVLVPLQEVLLPEPSLQAKLIRETLDTLEGKEGVKRWKDRL